LRSSRAAKGTDSVISFLGADIIIAELAKQFSERRCPKCQGQIVQQTQASALESLFRIGPNKTIAVTAILYQNSPGKEHKLPPSRSKIIDQLIAKGFSRFIVNESELRLDSSDTSWRALIDSKDGAETIGVIVDRLSVNESNRSRIIQSVQNASQISSDNVRIYEIDNAQQNIKPLMQLNDAALCQQCGYESFNLSPTLFKFDYDKSTVGYSGANDLAANYQGEFLKLSILGLELRQILEERISSIIDWLRRLLTTESDKHISALSSIISLLFSLGLGHLSLANKTSCLSSGEWHRLKLAKLLCRSMPGIMYIVDSPSMYLHSQDKTKVAQTIQDFHRLHSNGAQSTILIVDNSPEFGKIASNEIRLESSSNQLGPQIAYIGKTRGQEPGLAQSIDPIKSTLSADPAKLKFASKEHLNIKPFDISIPLGGLTIINGISGSGKTALVFGCLLPALTDWLNERKPPTKAASLGLSKKTTTMTLDGRGTIKRLISLPVVAQSERSRSSISQFIGLSDPLAKLFAMLPMSKQRGYTAKTFNGAGVDNFEIKEVRFKDYSFADILRLSISEASPVFINIPGGNAIWLAIQQLGLEYLPLHREISALSTSEWQRLQLLPVLVRTLADTVLLIDYPCAGLDDSLSARIANLLRNLANQGTTVVAIDNSPYLNRQSDYIIELGPNAGILGGNIVSAELKSPTYS
jgi:excinuclease UvrABC ATPase subunit